MPPQPIRRVPVVELSQKVYDGIQEMSRELGIPPSEVIGNALGIMRLALDAQRDNQILTLTDAASGRPEKEVLLR